MGSELYLIATILEKYYKVCERAEIFISQNSAEDKSAAAPYDKRSTSSGIWLKKIKLDQTNMGATWEEEWRWRQAGGCYNEKKQTLKECLR